MKKLLLEWAFYFAVASAYSLWKYRDQIGGVIAEIDDELTEYAQNQKAVESVLRSIRKLPETDKGGD